MKRRAGRSSRERALPNDGYFINEHIRAYNLRVISDTGENLGLLSKEDALAAAVAVKLDLVQISGDVKDDNVTAKIMDFGKFLYEKKKQAVVAKKSQKIIDTKEIKMRPSIDSGDYNFKVERIAEFLLAGKHVKVTLQFRGRQIPMKEILGGDLYAKILENLEKREGMGAIEIQKESKGNNVWSQVFVSKINS